MTDRCAVSDCNKPAAKRGLCHMHYYRTGRTNVKDPQRIEALKYILPSRKGQRPLCPKPPEVADIDGDLDDLDPTGAILPQRIDRTQRALAKRADIRIGAITEFAMAFEIKCIEDNCNGRIYEHPTQPILVRLDDRGELHEVEFVKSKAKDCRLRTAGRGANDA